MEKKRSYKTYSKEFKEEAVALVHLLKWIYYEQDINGRDVDLRYTETSTAGKLILLLLKMVFPSTLP